MVHLGSVMTDPPSKQPLTSLNSTVDQLSMRCFCLAVNPVPQSPRKAHWMSRSGSVPVCKAHPLPGKGNRDHLSPVSPPADYLGKTPGYGTGNTCPAIGQGPAQHPLYQMHVLPDQCRSLRGQEHSKHLMTCMCSAMLPADDLLCLRAEKPANAGQHCCIQQGMWCSACRTHLLPPDAILVLHGRRMHPLL